MPIQICVRVYMGVDSLKYDAILCPKCGYAALNRYFNFVMSSQAKNIKEKISANFLISRKQERFTRMMMH